MVAKLRLREALENNRFDGTGRVGDEARQDFAFDFGEGFKDVRRRVLLAGGATDADAHAQELGTDVVDGRTNTVLTPVGTVSKSRSMSS